MSSTCIDLLIDVMEKCHVPKQLLLDAIDQVRFCSAASSPVRSESLSRPLVPKCSRNTSRVNLAKYCTRASSSATVRKASTNNPCEDIPKPAKVFIDRLSIYEKERDERRIRQKKMLEEKERLTCYFKPQINRGNKTYSGRPVHDKLYELHKKRQEKNTKLKAEKDKLAKSKEIMECTFKPLICSKQGKPRFMRPSKMSRSSQYRAATSRSVYQIQDVACCKNIEEKGSNKETAPKNLIHEENVSNVLKEVINAPQKERPIEANKDDCVPILRRKLMSHMIEKTLLQKRPNSSSIINISLMKTRRAKSKYCDKENAI
eukprot:TRINITY_DN10231_c0_g1_i20.p1 TRINITY_DN10231_c0_g1~~TRINITY_DN10231_c0_g1_i20.p1  ORF type:complete len:317 (+),score=64.88 TRINITY_DN10231_c0_g1_i20:154-1104(+)